MAGKHRARFTKVQVALASLGVAAVGGALALTGAGVTSAAPSGGSGGPLSDRLNLSFSSGGLTSTYHLFAQGVDTTKEVGFLLYLDGSGAYGLKNPNDPYLLDADASNASQSGLRDVARDNNMILLTATAPPPSDADGDNCWYNTSTTPNAAAKARWLKALVDQVYAQYPIEKDRVAMGGYSSGAQGIMRWFAPMFGPAVQTDGVNVGISFGGAPDASAGTPTFTADYKSKVAFHWNVGTNDTTGAYSTASYGALGGRNWYQANGFATTLDTPAIGHSRSDFDDVVRAQIAKHVRPAATVGTPTPTPDPTPAPADYPTTVTPSTSNIKFNVTVPADTTGDTYVRIYDASTGASWYEYQSGTGTLAFTFTDTDLPYDGRQLSYKVFAGSSQTTTPKAQGTFTTAVKPVAWDTTVTPSRTGGSFATPIPSGYSGSVYVKLSDGSYVYETGQVGPKTLTQSFSTRQCGTTYDWRVEAPSGTLRDSGSFTTLPC